MSRAREPSVESDASADRPWVNPRRHRCRNHKEWPKDFRSDGSLRLEPKAYTTSQILEALKRITEGERTTAQQLEYEFVTDFFLADIENVSNDHLRMILWGWAKMLDEYFFGGTLTRLHHQIVKLDIVEWPRYSRRYPSYEFGCSTYDDSPLSSRISISRSYRKVRLPKHFMLDTLMHELVHVYVDAFCARCPLDGGDFPVDGPENDGHGPLFLAVQELVMARLIQWHPSFTRRRLRVPPYNPPSWADIIERYYIDTLVDFRCFEASWNQGARYKGLGLVRWERDIIDRDRFPDLVSYVHHAALDYRFGVFFFLCVVYFVTVVGLFILTAALSILLSYWLALILLFIFLRIVLYFLIEDYGNEDEREPLLPQ